MLKFESLAKAIQNCERCPRLRKHCLKVKKEKKREFKDWDYWGKPVPGFGDYKAKVWIIGLAPAAHGANRTGRMFTGDSSGNWLYKALFETGFANQPTSVSPDDGLKLKDVYISAVNRCAPPDNKPTPKEMENCAHFLDEEFKLLQKKKVLLVLGKIAFDNTLKMLERFDYAIPSPRPKFKHGFKTKIGDLTLLASYHPSRQNTNTKKLTEKMWLEIFLSLKNLQQ